MDLYYIYTLPDDLKLYNTSSNRFRLYLEHPSNNFFKNLFILLEDF